ncbi:hypothetical protein D1007_19864 [Hordeum vulgare]|nr:hypothetical protein D1007_19864 [Hordeum vulgare]
MAGDDWRCRKHPPVPCGGVCPHCLCDRLLRLCPDCARTRPCPCASPSSPSSSASSASVGRVCSLIERERRIGRSRSVAGGDERRRSRVWGWASFRKPAAGRGMELENEEEHHHAAKDAEELERSSSVSGPKVTPKAGGWGRFLPGPIKALRHRKSRAAAGAGARGDRREGVR